MGLLETSWSHEVNKSMTTWEWYPPTWSLNRNSNGFVSNQLNSGRSQTKDKQSSKSNSTVKTPNGNRSNHKHMETLFSSMNPETTDNKDGQDEMNSNEKFIVSSSKEKQTLENHNTHTNHGNITPSNVWFSISGVVFTKTFTIVSHTNRVGNTKNKVNTVHPFVNIDKTSKWPARNPLHKIVSTSK
ncbi:hypothetical protein CTRG_00266 [Candida tropicalis MYA-3404]|uniref:Uncharacterized protein n=1 Tax=Candida tropicalis (strain ATCC MYA-3404 / T1) TaxID=294747 RepID=C5M2H7_CANTT|nr:hypothetical protein CTRG_00266 [Candida tropicalis MYA-3404]EER35527.1 hypothetical protein CTRG_00266 [Candida tropicalis MYA-3404]KAG4409634.1 hypothetical protein JTP64_000272 [Candida tropicalis]